MKQLLILSGKGGTGKTTVAAAFIEFQNGNVFADCDVDAPNLHLVMQDFSQPDKSDYHGFKKAFIDPAVCTQCGLCEEHCRFDAIHDFSVGIFECEGCGVCAAICPVKAITMRDHVSGDLMLYRDKERVFSTAQLKMGSGASGKLVSAVKTQLADHAPPDAELAVVDGSPGIGCPVIASISGVDYVLVVAEPTVSGIHDMQRILETAAHFGVSCGVCINKYDTAPEQAKVIDSTCHTMGVEVLGRIPYDETVIRALNQCESIARYPDSPAGKEIKKLWQRISQTVLPSPGALDDM